MDIEVKRLYEHL